MEQGSVIVKGCIIEVSDIFSKLLWLTSFLSKIRGLVFEWHILQLPLLHVSVWLQRGQAGLCAHKESIQSLNFKIMLNLSNRHHKKYNTKYRKENIITNINNGNKRTKL